jgi:hypothetical protein
MVHKWIKITVTVEQWQSVLDTSRSDQRIYGLAYGDPEAPQMSEISRCLNGQRLANDVDLVKGAHQSEGIIEIAIFRETLQYLGDNDVTDHYNFMSQKRIQRFGLG